MIDPAYLSDHQLGAHIPQINKRLGSIGLRIRLRNIVANHPANYTEEFLDDPWDCFDHRGCRTADPRLVHTLWYGPSAPAPLVLWDWYVTAIGQHGVASGILYDRQMMTVVALHGQALLVLHVAPPMEYDHLPVLDELPSWPGPAHASS